MTTSEQASSHFRIGAVSRLTGVPADTLRVWERRHRVVTPLRTATGSRLYDQQDIARLTLIKRLVDAGQAIGTVASLSLEQLRDRAGDLGGVFGKPGTGPLSIVVVGTTLPTRLEATRDRRPVDLFTLAGGFASLDEFEASTPTAPVDVLVVEVPILNERAVTDLQRVLHSTRVSQVALVYGFARSSALRRLAALGIAALRYPIDWGELHCLFAAAAQPTIDRSDRTTASSAPPRLFDDRQLAALMAQHTGIACECPQHLADMVMSLARFEQYSRDCADQTPQDAALHAYLNTAAAHARATLEGALQRVIQADGLVIDAPAGAAETAATGSD